MTGPTEPASVKSATLEEKLDNIAFLKQDNRSSLLKGPYVLPHLVRASDPNARTRSRQKYCLSN